MINLPGLPDGPLTDLIHAVVRSWPCGGRWGTLCSVGRRQATPEEIRELLEKGLIKGTDVLMLNGHPCCAKAELLLPLMEKYPAIQGEVEHICRLSREEKSAYLKDAPILRLPRPPKKVPMMAAPGPREREGW